MIGGALGILAAIVGITGLAIFLGSSNTSSIISAIFNGFTGSLSAASAAGK